MNNKILNNKGDVDPFAAVLGLVGLSFLAGLFIPILVRSCSEDQSFSVDDGFNEDLSYHGEYTPSEEEYNLEYDEGPKLTLTPETYY